MSARLTEEEEWFDLLTEVADGINRDDEPSPWDRLIADRAAILESERDLLAALEAVENRVPHWPRDGQGVGWNPSEDAHSAFCPACAARAAIANARKQDVEEGGS